MKKESDPMASGPKDAPRTGSRQDGNTLDRQRQTAAALQEDAARYRFLFEASPAATVLYDEKGLVLKVNKAFVQIYGWPKEELIGRQIDFVPPEEVEKTREATRRTLLGESVTFDTRRRTKSGKTIHIQLLTAPFRAPDGTLSGVYVIHNDISEMKRAYAALEESERRNRQLLDASPDPITVYDDRGRVTYVNPAFEQTFGWTQKELEGRGIDFVPDHEKERTKEAVLRTLQGENVLLETERMTKDGRLLAIQLKTAIFTDSEGKLAGDIVIYRDISKRRQAEEELRRHRNHLEELVQERTRELGAANIKLQQAQKMEAIGTLAGGVAHDLNNILSGLVSYPDLLLLDIDENSPLRKHILKIKESGQKAAAIVQDLLTLARRGVSVADVVNINRILADLMESPEFAQLKAVHRGILFDFRLSDDLLNTWGSSFHLSKSFMNVIANAAEAMSGSGKVSVRTENRYIDRPIKGYEDVKEGDYVLFSVEDSGVGLPPEEIPRIFEPFYTKKVMGRSGTGLGMTVVWGTVKDHDGYIDIDSTPGEGTRLSLYFPVTRHELPLEAVAAPLDRYAGREKIMVVDDVKEQREIALQILSRFGYTVVAASSGEEAVALLKKDPADLVLLDMIMSPGMDGLETYQKILEFHPSQRAIIASGFSETGRVKKAQRLGAGEYIKKPYTVEKLGLAVKKELGRKVS